jgi:hypothetical protein
MVGVVRGVFGEVFISPLLGSNIRYIRAQGWRKLIGLSKINAPLKVQIFTSRLCGDIISTMTLLRARGVSCSLNCPWSVHNETCYHVLFLCRRVWNAGTRFIISLGPDWKTTSTCKLLSRDVLSFVGKTIHTWSTIIHVMDNLFTVLFEWRSRFG